MKSYYSNEQSYKKLLNTPYKLIALIILIVIIVSSVSQYRLYQIGLQQQKDSLTEIAQSRVSIINTSIEHYQNYIKNDQKEKIEKLIVKDLMRAQEQFPGFRKTGEYTLAKLDNNNIHFLLQHRHTTANKMNILFKNSNLAEPMRRALSGQHGNIVGLDYRGKDVVAAYEYIEKLGWGIVAKIDISEIKKPYIREAVNTIVWSILIITIGGIIILILTHPLIEEIEAERKYNRMLFNEIPIGLALTDFDGNIMDVNPAYLNIIGYSKEEILNMSYWDITPLKYKGQEHKQLSDLLKTGSYGPYEKEYIHKDNHLVNVKLCGTTVEFNNERFIWSHVEDITERQRNELALHEAALVFEHTHEGIMITDADIKIVRTNSTFTDITGYSFDDVKGKNPRFLQSGHKDKNFYKNMWNIIHSKGTWYGELTNRRKDGGYFTSLQSITAVKDQDEVIKGYVSVFSDISDRKNYENQLSHLANHDGLTSLPNRMHFNDNLNQLINMAKREQFKIAVLFLDLNGFKQINDTYGHDCGDSLLIEVSKRLLQCVREEDTVSRLGGDEFAIILPKLQRTEDALNIAKKIIYTVSKPFKIDSDTITPSTSIGISIYPTDSQDGQTLLKQADKAMYIAKRKQEDKYELFDSTKDYD